MSSKERTITSSDAERPKEAPLAAPAAIQTRAASVSRERAQPGVRPPAGRAWAVEAEATARRASGQLCRLSGTVRGGTTRASAWVAEARVPAMADDVVTLAIATAAAVLSGSPHEDALIRDLAASASDRPDAHACLKRLERTVGKHYCALWTQVRGLCEAASAVGGRAALRLGTPNAPASTALIVDAHCSLASRSAAGAVSTRTGSTRGARRPTAGCPSPRPRWHAPGTRVSSGSQPPPAVVAGPQGTALGPPIALPRGRAATLAL